MIIDHRWIGQHVSYKYKWGISDGDQHVALLWKIYRSRGVLYVHFKSDVGNRYIPISDLRYIFIA